MTTSAAAPFKTPGTLVYRYACEPASEADQRLLCDQLGLAAEYRRELARIENRGRAWQRAWSTTYADPGIRQERKRLQQTAGTSVDGEERTRWAEVSDAAKAHVADGASLAPGVSDVTDFTDRWDVSRRLAAATLDQAYLSAQRARAIREARARLVQRGLTWGTYQHADEGFSMQTRSTSLRDDVRVPSRAAVGCVAVHLQPARTLRGFEDSWVRFGARVVRGSAVDRSGRVRPAKHHQVMLRLGTQDDRSPRWVTVLALLDRPVPPGAVVSWAKVRRRRVGPTYRWELQITTRVDPQSLGLSPASAERGVRLWAAGMGKRQIARVLTWGIRDARRCAWEAERAGIAQGAGEVTDAQVAQAVTALAERVPLPPKIGGSVGVDIGWRRLGDRVRIARWWGTDGRSGELAIRRWVLDADEKADSLLEIRDRNKNEIAARVIAYVGSLRDRLVEPVEPAEPAGDTPDPAAWIVAELPAMRLWRRTARWVGLVARWRDARIPGDETVFDAVLAWLKQDRHLWAWEANTRVKRQRRVEAQIHLLAAQLCREYDRIGIEAPFVADLVRRAPRCPVCASQPKRCETCVAQERLRRLASTRVPHAAPARTREILQATAPRCGAVVIELDPAHTTEDCAALLPGADGEVVCGHRRVEVTDWSPLDILCSSCGTVEDQDLTAGKNLARAASGAVLGADGRLLASDSPGKARTSRRTLGPRSNRRAKIVDRSRTA